MSDILLREEPAPGVVLLRLNRPDKLNALSNALVTAIGDAYAAAATDGVTRAIVVTGSERAFAAGADIAEFTTSGPDLGQWDRLWACELPIVAAVRGVAFGGGLELAMSCDLMVVADDARLGQPEIRLGVMPGAGGTQRLTRAVGKALASEMIFLGRELDGRTAVHHGLANHHVPSERVEATAIALARTIAQGPPLAMRAAKHAIAAAFEQPLSRALHDERAAFVDLLHTADGLEGVTAFSERRAPVWSGR